MEISVPERETKVVNKPQDGLYKLRMKKGEQNYVRTDQRNYRRETGH